MTEREKYEPDDVTVKARVTAGLDEARHFARSLSFDEAKTGEWFLSLLRRVVDAHDSNARAEYFRQKYPGLTPDEIADVLVSVTVRYAAIAGGIAGATATANQVAALGTSGMTAPLFVSTIGAEMLYLARIQMRLVLDLSVIYDLSLDPEDPEDVLMVFGYALGVAPAGMLGKGIQAAARGGTNTVIKRYVGGSTLKFIQDFARRLGFKVLQRTILKYAVPVVSAAAGSGYNYVSTKAVGKIAKAHFKRRSKLVAELQGLVSRENTYDLAFPAAVLRAAKLDGEPTVREKELYRAMLSRMTFPEHTQDEFQRLVDDEVALLERLGSIEDAAAMRRGLVSALVLITTCDGELSQEERRFLSAVAECLGTRLDLDEVQHRALNQWENVKKSVFRRMAGAAGGAAAGTFRLAGHSAQGAKHTVLTAGGRVRSGLGKYLRRAEGADLEEPLHAWARLDPRDAVPDPGRLIDAVLWRSTGKDSRVHGVEHWKRVARAGLALLPETPGADPLVVFLFALFHDSMRLNDGHDPLHGPRGAELARELHGEAFELSEERMRMLEFACEEHTNGSVSSDPTIGVCWDSDRLNLWRVGITPSPSLLSTEAAKSEKLTWWAHDLQGQTFGWEELQSRFGL